MKSILTYNNETVKHKILTTNMYKQRLRISYVTYIYLGPMLLTCHGALHGRCLLHYFFYPWSKSYLTMTGQ